MNVSTCCTDEYDQESLAVVDALQRIESEIIPIQGHIHLPLSQCLGWVLAQTVVSPINLPSFPHSAMDGYAVRAADLSTQSTTTLRIIDTVFAGKPSTQALSTGECVRIFTGAMLPEAADTVIMQEHVQLSEDQTHIKISAAHAHGQHIVSVGENIRVGDSVLVAGKRLLPANIGVLASLGISDVLVMRRVRVAFFSTGDELCELGHRLQAGQIYDSNRYTLLSLLQRLNMDTIDMGHLPDDPAAIEQTLLQAVSHCDAILTSGGVSVGDADFVTAILRKIGQLHFWKVAMKPGRPLAFGKIQQIPFFGLPGNPVSMMSVFYQFVQPALRRLQGQMEQPPLRFKVPCLSPLKKLQGRMEFQRGILSRDTHGILSVRSTGKQGASLLSSMTQANCFIVLPVECTEVAVGDEIWVEPFEGLI